MKYVVVPTGWVGGGEVDYEVRYVTSYTQVYQPSEDLAAISLCPDLAAA